MSNLPRRIARLESTSVDGDAARQALARVQARHMVYLHELSDEPPPVFDLLAGDTPGRAEADERLIRDAGIASGIMCHEEALLLLD